MQYAVWLHNSGREHQSVASDFTRHVLKRNGNIGPVTVRMLVITLLCIRAEGGALSYAAVLVASSQEVAVPMAVPARILCSGVGVEAFRAG